MKAAGFVFAAINQGIVSAFPLLVFIVFARHISLAEYGTIVIYYSVAQYLNVAIEFTAPVTSAAALSRAKSVVTTSRIIRQYRTIRILLGICVSPIFLIVTAITSPGTLFPHPLIWIAMSAAATQLSPFWYAKAIGDIAKHTAAALLGRGLLLAALPIYLDGRVAGVHFGYFLFAGPLITSIIASVFYSFPRQTLPSTKTHIKQAWVKIRLEWDVFLSLVSVALLTNSSTIILGLFCGKSEAASFSIAERIARGMSLIGLPIEQATAASAASRYALSVREGRAYTVKIWAFGATLFISVALLTLFFSHEIVVAFSGSKNYDAQHALMILSILPLVSYSNAIFGTQALLAIGVNRIYSKIVVCAGAAYAVTLAALAAVTEAPVATTAALMVGTELLMLSLFLVLLLRQSPESARK